jgi:hypothetical protein
MATTQQRWPWPRLKALAAASARSHSYLSDGHVAMWPRPGHSHVAKGRREPARVPGPSRKVSLK